MVTTIIKDTDFKNYDERKRIKFINALSGFKSANLVGTINNEGQTNLSIISSVVHLGASPALIGLVIRPDIARRDTLENIRENGFFTINHVNESIVEKAHQTSARYPQDQSEFVACGLTPEYVEHKEEFPAPFVQEANIKMAIKFVREIEIEENGTHFLIGEIKSVHLPQDCLEEDGHIDIHKAGTICVSGLDAYFTTAPLGRLSYAKADRNPSWL
ncbi:flavin reductase family protein [Halobacteriovorax sp. ZH4_bin.1]|uniref:flavin reductase family protein n=1 Tax=unclassified Halobacteriovorax TaxID=2639665 RepID=UPI0037227B3E